MLAQFLQRLTDRARSSLLMSIAEADALGHAYIGTEHILLGIMAEGEGVAFQAIQNRGGVEGMRDEVMTILGVSPIAQNDRVVIKGKTGVRTVLAIHGTYAWVAGDEQNAAHEIVALADLTKVD